MKRKDIQISFIGMEPTKSIKKYVKDKICKYEHLWSDATSLEVYLKEYANSRGVKDDFRIDINVSLPNSVVRVEVKGEDMYANIDEASDTLYRRLKRYHDKKAYWEGVTPWKVLESDNQLEVEDYDDYSDYVPQIAVRKKIKDISPIEEAEAIEKMELAGYNQLLFRNKNTGKMSMVYRREDGSYGLVEPADNDLIV